MAGILYCGMHQAAYGDMALVGSIIRDAWDAGITPQYETCKGVSHHHLQLVDDQRQAEWRDHDCLAAGLPEDLKQHQSKLFRKAVQNAPKPGWNPELGDQG